jgi:hypothetical protein
MYSVIGKKLSINKTLLTSLSLEFHPDTIKEIYFVHEGIRNKNLHPQLLTSLLAKLLEGRDGGPTLYASTVSFLLNIITGGGSMEVPIDHIYIQQIVKEIGERHNYGLPVPKKGEVWIWQVKDTSLLGPNISSIVENRRNWMSKMVSKLFSQYHLKILERYIIKLVNGSSISSGKHSIPYAL